MLLTAIAFYVFSVILLASAAMVVSSRNPVHSVLFLILSFFNAAALFLIAGAEFLAMILVIVYVGAVAVLFLFVVMMLDVDFAELRQGFLQYMPIGAVVGGILLIELVLVLFTWAIGPDVQQAIAAPAPPIARMLNTEALGHVLGYCIGIDFSERDFQFNRGGQGFKGKSADTFAPLGPFLATHDEIVDQLAEWRDHGLSYPVLSNLSTMQPSLRRGLAAGNPFAKVMRGVRKL